MATRDRGIALGLAAVALAYLAAARRYPLDTLSAPGPGAFPLATGVALFLVAAWLLVTARPPAGAAAAAALEIPGMWRRVPLLLTLVLGLHAAALPWLGFIPASFLLVLAAARLMGLPGLWRPLALAGGLVLAMRLVFVTWLGVPLP
jgi:hypothetical protein